MAKLLDQFAESGGGEAAVLEKPKTRAEKLVEWRENQGGVEAYGVARLACCVCTPSRAQLFLLDNWDNGPSDL